MLSSVVGRLRAAGIVEGISFLLLLGVAMPLKYMAGMPMAVTVVGGLHGLLFVLFCVALYDAHVKKKWGAKWSLTVFLCAVIPFGPFLIDGKLKAMETDDAGAAA